MRIPAISLSAKQFSDPRVLAQLRHRSLNSPANLSHIDSSTVHVKNVQPHDSHFRQIPHQNIGLNHLGRPAQGMNLIARDPLKTPAVGQKKPLEGLGSSPPPPRSFVLLC